MSQLNDDISFLRNKQFQRAYQWECILPSIDSIDGSIVSCLAQSISYGDYSMESPKTFRAGAFQMKFASFFGLPSFTVGFIETENFIVTNYFRAWRKKIAKKIGLFSVKSNYAHDIILNYLSASGAITRSVKFINAFPLDTHSVELSYAKNDIVHFNIKFACDRLDISQEGL